MENKTDSIPLVAVAGMMVVGGVVAAMAMQQAAFASQGLCVTTPGREAAIIHLVLRGAVKNAVLCTAALLACWRCLRAAGVSKIDWLVLLSFIKIVVAVFAASSISQCVSLIGARICPLLHDQIAGLGGWRGFQLLDLVLVVGLILVFVVLADAIERRIKDADSTSARIAFAGAAILVFVVVSSSAFGQMVCGPFASRHGDAIDENGVEEPQRDDDFRLDADEPWELSG